MTSSQKKNKHAIKSKTFGVALLNVVILKVFPESKAWIAKNPEAYAEILTIAMVLLRQITSGGLKWNMFSKK